MGCSIKNCETVGEPEYGKCAKNLDNCGCDNGSSVDLSSPSFSTSPISETITIVITAYRRIDFS